MDTQEIMKRLRQPATRKQQNVAATANQSAAQPQKQDAQKKSSQNVLLLGITAAVAVMIFITFSFFLSAKNRAENVTDSLDPANVQGLTVQGAFNPYQNVTYVQISEGQDRNVAVSNLGTTLPIISRFNYKALTPENFQVIGTAPWALTTNISSNIDDPEMVRYLLANDNMIQAFLIRDDVAPLLENPSNLAALAQDQRAMRDFFEDETTKQVLDHPQIIQALSNSRFMAFLLISQAAKYFRAHPQEAADLIAQSPYLQQLQANPDIAEAVRENRYLANIADELLTARPAITEQAPVINAQQPQKEKKSSKKKKKS